MSVLDRTNRPASGDTPKNAMPGGRIPLRRSLAVDTSTSDHLDPGLSKKTLEPSAVNKPKRMSESGSSSADMSSPLEPSQVCRRSSYDSERIRRPSFEKVHAPTAP